ncbi:MAG: hypothetical protein RL375_1114 [Pseudomonadota bacterium]|jgi:type VI secretion system secreted protein Hcp
MALADMFLRVEGGKQGLIKGEVSEAAHLGEIEVLGWRWGMDGSSTAFGQTAARTSLQELVVRKRVDSATTALMSALRSNEVIKKATLSVRKAGGTSAVDYLRIVVEKARVVAHTVGSEKDGSPDLVEELRLAFFKVQVEYRSQDTGGGGKGASTFETEVQQG